MSTNVTGFRAGRRLIRLLPLLAILAAVPAAAHVAESGGPSPADPGRHLIVGTKEVPPFAMKLADGTWTGITIELWRELASELDYRYEFRELPLPALVSGLEDRSLDVVAAALTLTKEREESFDFTHPFFSSGLAIAINEDRTEGILAPLAGLFTDRLARILVVVSLALGLASVAIWAFEHRANAEQFGDGFVRGVGSAVWWSAVTMTTVGYGDKTPRTLGGRVVAVIWMIAGVILISGLTAAITSSLTVSRLETTIGGPAELVKHTVATVAGSTSEDYLRANGVPTIPFESAIECMHALARKDVEAVVYDEPVVRYLAHSKPELGIDVLPYDLNQSGGYGLGLTAGSPLREPLNRALLRFLDSGRAATLKATYLGAVFQPID